MVTNSALHGLDNIVAVIAVHQSQYTLGLMLATALLLQQTFQEAAGDFSQFAKPLPQFL